MSDEPIEGVFNCPDCDFRLDGRGYPHSRSNMICDHHALGEHGKRWRPSEPTMGKIVGVASKSGDPPVVIDEWGEWWTWRDGAWAWASYGVSL